MEILQLSIFDFEIMPQVIPLVETEAKIDLASYDKIIVYFSGGKDSLACLLLLLVLGVDPTKIELWLRHLAY